MPNITIPYELASNICAILGQLPAGQVAKVLVALDELLVAEDRKVHEAQQQQQQQSMPNPVNEKPYEERLDGRMTEV